MAERVVPASSGYGLRRLSSGSVWGRCFGASRFGSARGSLRGGAGGAAGGWTRGGAGGALCGRLSAGRRGSARGDRKSTRLNSSHSQISYAVFCLKKKKNKRHKHYRNT